MKIKILLAPSLIVIIIVLIIWYVYPAYTNGIDGAKEKRQQLAEQKKLVEKLDNSISNAGKLVADLNTNYFENSVVFSYIPGNKEEEKIIENLNLLAKESTLAVLNISISETKEVAVPVVEATPSSLSVNPLSGGASGVSPDQSPMSPKAVPKNLKVDFSVVGDYANIKMLLEKIQKVKRFNKFSALEIKALLKEDQTPSESLQINMTLEFNYLKELKRLLDGDINNPVFSAGSFDKQVIEKIRSSRSIEINNVLPGQKGGSNPFIVAK
jgi:hypothetical protein